MKKEELAKLLTDMVRDTKIGKIHWDIKCQTTEYNDLKDKPTEEIDGEIWTVDECYVSYYCEYKGKEFLMITYEMIHSAFRKQKTTNLIGQWRTVATTADGTPIDAKVQGDIVIISKNGKETQIPVAKGDVIPVHETSTDTFLIIKREGFRYTITQSDTPDID